MDSKQLYLIHGNKHREGAKTGRQRNMAQMKEQIKTLEKTKQNGDKQSIGCRVQNTGYKDAQGTQRGPQQHKKDPVRIEGYTN